MPSWNDGETSSSERLSDYSSDPPLNVPETMYDPDFCGIATDCEETCDHDEKLARYVAFEGVNTGRRFLGCARPGSGICATMHWLDLEWPPSLPVADEPSDCTFLGAMKAALAAFAGG
ncbi:hypothetical protein ACQ4PT_067930 [Festuca glaucescens]